MSRQIAELELMLLKHQAAFGTAEVSLAAADLAEVDLGAELSFDPAASEIELSSGGFPQYPSVIGPLESGIRCSMPVRTGGAEGNAGLVAKFLRICGFKETASDTDTDSINDRFIYTPSDDQVADWKDATMWGYSGHRGSSASILRKVSNIMGSGKFVLDFDKGLAKFEFNGKGAYSGAATAASQPVISRTSSVITPSLRAATVNLFNAAAYEPISLEFDFSQEVRVTLKPSAANGKGICTITKRRINWKAKVYKVVPASGDPETALINGTTGPISVAWGTSPNKITLSTTKAQITSLPDADDNGVECWELGGPCIDQDFACQIDTAQGT